jgi:hypothetical protein
MFFRYVKALSNKKGDSMAFNQIKKRFKKIPPAFIIASGAKRCKIHEFGCPTEDCPYITMNHKVILGR